MASPRVPRPANIPSGTSRRTALLGVPSTAALLALSARPAAAAPGDDYLAQGFKALAAYVVPGDDEYSVQQGLTAPRPGGVAAGADVMLEETYDLALPVAVAPGLQVNLPGAATFALVLELFARRRYPLEVIGPFVHPFANLTHTRKALVLDDIDAEQLTEDSALGYAFGSLTTLAAFASYGERGVFDPATGTLRERPVGWDLSGYDGVSNGWPELRGYWEGRTSARDVPDEAGGDREADDA